MTRQNVQTVRKAFDAFVHRDVERALEIMDSEVVLRAPVTQSIVGRDDAYRGHEGIREYFGDVAEAWEELEVFLHEYHDAGDGRVLVGGRVRARDREGELVEEPVQWAWMIREGKIISCRVFSDRVAALEATGIAAR
jgi:ketosteroid isomerase-like protein